MNTKRTIISPKAKRRLLGFKRRLSELAYPFTLQNSNNPSDASAHRITKQDPPRDVAATKTTQDGEIGVRDPPSGIASRNSAHCLAVEAAREKQRSVRDSLPPSLRVARSERDCIALFRREEIALGPLLGSGEYSHVYEVESFNISPLPSAASAGSHQDATWNAEEVEKRRHMKEHQKYHQSKNARYAIKHVREDYFDNSMEGHDPDAYVQAICDLTLEAEILASLAHPNIIKLRGTSHSGIDGFCQGPSGYFLITDRLFETLDQRMSEWRDVREERQSNHVGPNKEDGRVLGIGQVELLNGGPDSHHLEAPNMDEQLVIALQISAAVTYLHSHSIIFRDLKPANIGFDVRGDVKIFDFGLARIMPENGRHYDDTFKMSGAGSPRYMAPECLCSEAYNMKADVYSFAILLWEMLAGETPYEFARTVEHLVDRVVNDHVRPEIHDDWPGNIKSIMKNCFDGDIENRPKMKIVHNGIKTTLITLREGNSAGLSHHSIACRRSKESMIDLNSSMTASTKADPPFPSRMDCSHQHCSSLSLSSIESRTSMQMSLSNNFTRSKLQGSISAQSFAHLLQSQKLSRENTLWDHMREDPSNPDVVQNHIQEMSKQNASWNIMNQVSICQGQSSCEPLMLSV